MIELDAALVAPLGDSVCPILRAAGKMTPGFCRFEVATSRPDCASGVAGDAMREVSWAISDRSTTRYREG